MAQIFVFESVIFSSLVVLWAYTLNQESIL